jgi:hypothetical protein
MAATVFLAALALFQPAVKAGALQPYPLPFGLTVSFPDKPEALKPGKGDDRKAFTCTTEDAVFFASDCPVSKDEQKALPPDQQLAAYVYGLLEDEPDRHVSRYNDSLLDGWPGIEYQIDDKRDHSSTWARCYVLDGHIVEVGAVFATDAGAPKEVGAFFGSVKQTGAPKTGPLADANFSFSRIEPDQTQFALEFPAEVKDDPIDLSKDDYKMMLHRFTYERDMRTFDFEYLDLPDSAESELTSDDVTDLRQRTLDAVLKNVEGVSDSSSVEQRDGNDWLTARFHVRNAGYGRVDVLYLKGRVYTLIAMGPESWMDANEVHRFFDSAQVKSGS